jgi:hypothetical protein
MRKIAIVGSGQSALLAAHGLLQAGYAVELYSDRSPEDWLLRSRPTGTAVRFSRSLEYERQLGLGHWHDAAPRMDGLKVTICSGAAKPFLTMLARFATSPLAIDLRLQSYQWMLDFAGAGGKLHIGRITPHNIDDVAGKNDLTIVATGKDDSFFARDPQRTPCSVPMRRLAMVNCEGPPARFADAPFAAAKFNVLEGVGECYWTPYFHRDKKPLWNLVFEAKPGTALDRFDASRSGDEVLQTSKDIVREMLPWDYPWIKDATLADENSWLVGAVTPTVRDPLGRTPGGRRVIPLGDSYMTFDPLGAQGANMGNRLAKVLVEAIAARRKESFDDAWVRTTYDMFFERWGGPSMRWTHMLLQPMVPGARYMFLAQEGAGGVSSTTKQQLADAFALGFDDPCQLVDTLADFSRARRWVNELMGPRRHWEVARGLLSVASRRVRNAVA